jgi:hypothetical protein
MQQFGNPDSVNRNLIAAIQKIEVKTLPVQTSIVDVLFSELSSSHSLLDIGQSLRLHSKTAKSVCQNYKTLDLNRFKEYPDYLADICNSFPKCGINRALSLARAHRNIANGTDESI